MCRSSSLPRQSDEPALLADYVSDEWQLRRCVCGHSFGCRAGTSPSCTKCGSSNTKTDGFFGDSRLLAVAVSNANMPPEIANEISKRIHNSEKKSMLYNVTNADNNSSRTIQAMRDATDHTGILTVESLEKQLAKIGINEPSSQHLIGQAEIEGILLRIGSEKWSWLQQSS